MSTTTTTARWMRIARPARRPADPVGERWAELSESFWTRRFDALGARCAAAASGARGSPLTVEDLHHDR
jgi:hypothetical protein